jgi:hypothetical protein
MPLSQRIPLSENRIGRSCNKYYPHYHCQQSANPANRTWNKKYINRSGAFLSINKMLLHGRGSPKHAFPWKSLWRRLRKIGIGIGNSTLPRRNQIAFTSKLMFTFTDEIVYGESLFLVGLVL